VNLHASFKSMFVTSIMLNKLRIHLKLTLENAKMALQTLLANKLRSFLSVTGISIGIFSIVMVFTLIESLEIQIKNSLSTLGKSVVYIEVFPWETEDRKEYPWWKFIQRPDPDIKELEKIESSFVSEIIDAISFKMTLSNTRLVNSETGITLTGISVEGITHSFNQIQDVNIQLGRYFTQQECDNAQAVAIIGNTIASKLYEKPEDAIGKKLRLSNSTVTVIGVLTLEGENMMNNSPDEQVFLPVSFLNSMTGIETRANNPRILVKAKEGISIDALADELKGTMRSIRRLKPTEDDNFAINKVTFLIKYLDDFFSQVNLFGLIIGGFSLLVGGFGVANIMFVSVKERTGIIGIQKALGARKIYILQQFLTEAVVLCVIGGIIGMILVFFVTIVANFFISSSTDMTFKLIMTMDNLSIGLLFSIATGVVSGIIPAWVASRLAPIEAIRSNG